MIYIKVEVDYLKKKKKNFQRELIHNDKWYHYMRSDMHFHNMFTRLSQQISISKL